MEFDLANLDAPADEIATGFGSEIAPRFDMQWDISYSSDRPRIAILCTREPNCVLDLLRLGRELERQVLARAVRWHIEDRVLVYDNKTVVFH